MRSLPLPGGNWEPLFRPAERLLKLNLHIGSEAVTEVNQKGERIKADGIGFFHDEVSLPKTPMSSPLSS